MSQDNEKEVYATLQRLPEGLLGFYDNALERIEVQEEKQKILAKRVLSWITNACRPLTLRELQHALSIGPNMTRMDHQDLIFEDRLLDLFFSFNCVAPFT